MLLPFRPASEASSARNFVRNFFRADYEGSRQFTGQGLAQELRLAEPLVGTLRHNLPYQSADTNRPSAVS